jgi:hypothetical protein
LRLDFGFRAADIQYITQKLAIRGLMLNASTMRREEIEEIVSTLSSLTEKPVVKAMS